MIGIKLQGRLGNQLFQYAFILAASKKMNTGFYIDQYIESSITGKYFEGIGSRSDRILTRLFSITGFKNIFSYYLRRVYYKYFTLLTKYPVIAYNFEVGEAEITLRNNAIYQGYFQSQLFFKGFEALIRNKFILKQTFTDQFILKFGNFYQNNNIITVHIRRTDYQNLQHLNLGGNDLSLPLTYYKNAISRFDGQNAHFVFISDDLDFVNQNFKEISNKTVSTDTEIVDFQHLLNANGCIISNSTFSWWGAWLNNRPGKVIYAPKYFMGWRIKKETPKDIYPDNWILIDF